MGVATNVFRTLDAFGAAGRGTDGELSPVKTGGGSEECLLWIEKGAGARKGIKISCGGVETGELGDSSPAAAELNRRFESSDRDETVDSFSRDSSAVVDPSAFAAGGQIISGPALSMTKIVSSVIMRLRLPNGATKIPGDEGLDEL